MIEATEVTRALEGWQDFSLITGGASAALIGLQFVVQTLMATEDVRRVFSRNADEGTQAFATPTVVYFSIALLVSCALTVPWPGFGVLRLALFVLGASTVAYVAVVLRRLTRQRAYKPEFEDVLWHIVLPSAAAISLVGASLLLGEEAHFGPLFFTAAATLLLICIGIHNAWDIVTYLMLVAFRTSESNSTTAKPEPTAMPTTNAGAADVTIRQAYSADGAALGRLGGVMVQTHYDFDKARFMAPTPGTVEGYGKWLVSQAAKPGVIVLVAVRGEKVIGYAYAGVEGKDYMALRDEAGALYDIVVAPESRGMGVGGKLLNAVIDAFASRKVPRIVLMTAERNDGAQRLFAKVGFRRTMIEMTRELP